MRTEKTRLLRSGEVAKRLGLHPLTVRRWVKEGKIAAIPIGREARIPITEVERLLGEQRAGVVVTFSDRLTRFGLAYLQALFSGYGVTLTVLHPDEDNTPEEELTQDLLALIASFAGRLYGLRSRRQKALLDCAKQILAAQEE